MKVNNLETKNPHVNLVVPNLDRDPKISLEWLNGVDGATTLALMGNDAIDIKPTTIEHEVKRTEDFINSKDQLNWMIQLDGDIVGAIWVDLLSKEHMLSPSVHIMIGKKDARGKGVGYSSMQSVINYLEHEGFDVIYSRHLKDNIAATKLLSSLNFKKLGTTYMDENNLEWQNVVLNLDNY